ncbi:MAG: lipid II:glycine glycyltransferase FemX, partial [Anaerolineae bacterium]
MQAFTGGAREWNALIAALPNPHLLQTWEWGQVKAVYGWKPAPIVWKNAAAMLLRRQLLRRGLTARLCILYTPKGPVMDYADAGLQGEVLDDLQRLARREGAVLLKIDPDVVVGTGIPGEPGARELSSGAQFQSLLHTRGWLFSGGQVQFRNTVLLDLAASEDELLQRMKQKTRYNVRLAERKGVRVRAGGMDDLPMLYRMYAETSVRDGFVIRHEAYYRTVWETFMRPPADTVQPFAEPLIAEVDGEPAAAIFVFYFASRAYYLYGM